MFKKLSMKTSFIAVGIVIGLFVGVGIKQVFGDGVGGEVRNDNLTVNMGGATNGNVNGLIVAYGNALVAGNVGVGTTSPVAKLDVRGDIVTSGSIKSQTKLCIGATCVDENQLKLVFGTGNSGDTGGGDTGGGNTGGGDTGGNTGGGGTQSCLGSHPAEGNGVRLTYYTDVVSGPDNSTPNTEWAYGASSCGWSCIAPMVRNGDIGCQNPTPGTGVTVKIINASTGQGFSGIGVNPSIAGMNVGQDLGTFTTNSNGFIPEFWYPFPLSGGAWTSIEVIKSGYKIKSATGCTPWVFVHGGKQVNICKNATNSSQVTITLVPGDISSVPVIQFDKSSYRKGETLKGSVVGGDPYDTWSCMDSPNTTPGSECMSGGTSGWRKLGEAGDDWKIISTNDGDSIQLEGLYVDPAYPVGTYTGFVKTGRYGNQINSQSFTVTQ